MEQWRNELCHHGIQGQKWGVTNGPPYPLTLDKLSSKEKSGMQRSDKRLYNYKRKELNKLSKQYDRKTARMESRIDNVIKKSVKTTVDYDGETPNATHTVNMRLVDRANRLNNKLDAYKSRTEHQMDKVMNMSMAEMKKEKTAVGEFYAMNALGTLSSFALSSASGGSIKPLVFVPIPGVAKTIKRNKRMKDYAGYTPESKDPYNKGD